MIPSREFIEQAAAQTGYQAPSLEKVIIEALLVLSDEEQRYVNEVSEGALRLEYLFPNNPKEAARLTKHPALLWKIQNVQQARK